MLYKHILFRNIRDQNQDTRNAANKKQAELGMLESKKWHYVCFLKDIKTQFKKSSYIATVGMQDRKVFKRAVKLLYFLN